VLWQENVDNRRHDISDNEGLRGAEPYRL
jgi:hypothetical protein